MSNPRRMSDEPMAIQAIISSNFFLSFWIVGVRENRHEEKMKVATKKEI